MKRITLVTHETIDGARVQIGKPIENFPVPETLDEVLGMVDLDDGCNEAEIVACFVYGWKVKARAKVKNGSDPKAPTTIFKKIGQKKQDEILEMAREAGLL